MIVFGQALLLVLLMTMGSMGHAEILEDFDSLGGNDVLLERAQALQPDKEISVVQNRIVDRNFRHEISPEYTSVLGGDSYLNTQMIGLRYHFHINPRFAIGLNYFQAYNEFTGEGDKLITDDKLIPDVDYVKNGYEGIVDWYPIYGKFNLFDLAIVHFDLYALGGYGRIELSSGTTDSYTVGGGLGFWFSQHLSTRFEVRQKMYEAHRSSKAVDMNLTLASVSIGYML